MHPHYIWHFTLQPFPSSSPIPLSFTLVTSTLSHLAPATPFCSVQVAVVPPRSVWGSEGRREWGVLREGREGVKKESEGEEKREGIKRGGGWHEGKPRSSYTLQPTVMMCLVCVCSVFATTTRCFCLPFAYHSKDQILIIAENFFFILVFPPVAPSQ